MNGRCYGVCNEALLFRTSHVSKSEQRQCQETHATNFKPQLIQMLSYKRRDTSVLSETPGHCPEMRHLVERDEVKRYFALLTRVLLWSQQKFRKSFVVSSVLFAMRVGSVVLYANPK